ncbi:hypothetical protein EV200_101258 [Pedobacter psychrotolerans]|uniref:Uncharacterized protein n=1 Tax=Pedobacter psychrotolerans TaxID=1843235 RepID=A0A4R2HL54_9SPHI|nr:hypothetical protein [Pedobacter psychrotolerans]TCO30819.1 hypothetical protein EV200_101258 [Pedobacter psychrotolerans]GGE44251.1 hypothetical protein GCM10011413_07910 [Pedobacter psychrotolerans]
MPTDLIDELKSNISLLQNQPLSGGIVAKNLRISDNGSGELTLYGDFTITLKVLDLTTNGAPDLNSLMTFTQQVITSKLRGGGYKSGINFLKYNAVKKAFDKDKTWTYSIRYNFNFSVNVIQINMLNQLRGNDFVLAVVDSIGHQFTDQYGKRHYSGGLTNGKGGPAVITYDIWKKNRYLGVHEFFHTLGLDDIEDHGKKERLMYHLDDNTGQSISDTERGDMMHFIMGDLRRMLKGNYSNVSNNTIQLLRIFINNKTNGFKYNKAKFR